MLGFNWFYLQCDLKKVDVASHDAYYLLSVAFSLWDINITMYKCVGQLQGAPTQHTEVTLSGALGG